MNLSNISEIKISYIPKFKNKDLPKINSSLTASKLVKQNWDDIDYYESFAILLLNRANKVLGMRTISTGGISGTVVDPKLIFQAALKANASGIILVHNHPSGNIQASEADKKITNKIISGGKLLDITVLDHLIITSDNYLSFADENLLL